MRWVRGVSAGLIILIGALSPAAAQTPAEKAPFPAPDLLALAQQMPDCKEFRNACQVCVRLSDGKLGCSNIGVACSPSGDWRCSALGKPGEPTK
jgi:hypothetical protein